MLIFVLTALLAVPLSYLVFTMFSRKNYFPVDGRTILITGGSQGLGLALGKYLATKGANIVIVARNQGKLDKALHEIQSCSASLDRRHLALSYDLTDPNSALEILRKIAEWTHGEPPDIVINCAGFCVPGFFASTDVDVLRQQMDTVYWSCVYMAHATLNTWTESASSTPTPQAKQTRHLIFTSSVLAFMPLAGYAPYNPAKAAMRSLVDTLSQEVQVYNGMRKSAAGRGPPADIKVHGIYPMGIQSPGYINEQKSKPALTQELEKDDKPQDPDELAKVIVGELEAGRQVITTALIGNIMKGWAFGASTRVGLMDYVWNLLGTVVVWFIIPDFLGKCYAWGKSKGLRAVNDGKDG